MVYFREWHLQRLTELYDAVYSRHVDRSGQRLRHLIVDIRLLRSGCVGSCCQNNFDNFIDSVGTVCPDECHRGQKAEER